MATLEDFARLQEAPKATQPQVVYVQGGRHGFLKLAAAMILVGVAAWAVKSGDISITQDAQVTAIKPVATAAPIAANVCPGVPKT